MSIKAKPLHDRVLIKRLEEEQRSAGGIVILIQLKKNPFVVKLLPLDLEKFWITEMYVL